MNFMLYVGLSVCLLLLHLVASIQLHPRAIKSKNVEHAERKYF